MIMLERTYTLYGNQSDHNKGFILGFELKFLGDCKKLHFKNIGILLVKNLSSYYFLAMPEVSSLPPTLHPGLSSIFINTYFSCETL